jgi:hypothetical protein
VRVDDELIGFLVGTVVKLPPRPTSFIRTEIDPDAIPEEAAQEVIHKAKVEDDEYKQSGEQTYYG